jgi:ureidoglycolate lyase
MELFMKTVKVQPLSIEAFAPYGSYTNIVEPKGDSLGGPNHTFYRDNSRWFCESSLPVGFSPLMVKKQDMKITGIEYHTTTCEGILPISDDAILHVTPAGGPNTDRTAAFLVPKGTMVTLYPGVYHATPLPANNDELYSLIVLPERAYANDFYWVDLDEADQFEIVK